MAATVREDTKVRVCRALKQGLTNTYGADEWYLTTRVGHLKEVLDLRHSDAIRRITVELANDPIAFFYVNGVRFSVQIES